MFTIYNTILWWQHNIAIFEELSGTTKQGTTLLGLYQAAGQVGFDAKGCETDILSLKEHGSPVILHLVLDGKFEHYMVCYGFKDGYFIMGILPKE